jgi:hypothetical protein
MNQKLNMSKPPKIPDSFIIIPRSVLGDYQKGLITIVERNLLCWLRLNGNPYGIASINLEVLAKETFNRQVDKSYINRLLLSLKSKGYIWYLERKGRRGSFEVYLDNWPRPDKSIQHLDGHFEQSMVRRESMGEVVDKSEVGEQVGAQRQRLSPSKGLGPKPNSLM